MQTYAPTETQKTVYEVLSNDAALTLLLGGAGKVFDHVPQNTEYPYISMNIKPWNDRGNHDYEGLETNFQINVWYSENGRGDLKVQQIQKRIDELLHNTNICIEGWNIISLRRVTIDILNEPDGVTKHGVQIYKLLIGEI